MKTAIIVPTLNAGFVWKSFAEALLRTGVSPDDVYIIDSGSVDGTVKHALELGFNLTQIPSCGFNHGGTRQMAVSMLDGYGLVVFLTQDAVLSRSDAIRKILSPFQNKRVGAVCGRQLPNPGAGPIEAHARLYNYGTESEVYSLDDAAVKGLKAAFMSNSFAAYRVPYLLDVGGFPSNVVFGEDMYVAAKMLLKGYKIAYAADALVYHSHDYSVTQEFKRYFDMGVLHAREPWLQQKLGAAEKEGLKFVLSEMNYLARHAVWRIPEALLRTLSKYAGFRLGRIERHMSMKLKRKISMNPGYFNKG